MLYLMGMCYIQNIANKSYLVFVVNIALISRNPPPGLVKVSSAPENQCENGSDAPPATASPRVNLFRIRVRAQGLVHFLASNLADQRVECLVDVMTQCSRCLKKWAAELVGEIPALLGGHASLRLQVHLVGNQN